MKVAVQLSLSKNHQQNINQTFNQVHKLIKSNRIIISFFLSIHKTCMYIAIHIVLNKKMLSYFLIEISELVIK